VDALIESLSRLEAVQSRGGEPAFSGETIDSENRVAGNE
jgi:hypothetical protein